MSARDRIRNPAPWLSTTGPKRYSRTGGRPPRDRRPRRLGLLDAVVVVGVLLAVWSTTPVGAVAHLAVAAAAGWPVEDRRPLTAWFDTGTGEADAVEALLARPEPVDPSVPDGGLPQPWRTALATVLDGGPLPATARAHLARVRLEDPDATALHAVDALYDDDPAAALEAFALGADVRDRAIARARAAGADDPESWHAHRAYLPLRSRMVGDRLVGRTLALGTALDLTWPVDDRFRLTSGFGHRHHPVLGKRRFHNGVDLATPVGTPVHAARDGRVRVGEDAVSGRYIVIDHGHGVRTSYCHLDEAVVARGEHVGAGQLIGRTGNTGRSTGPHLHFVVRVGRTAVDPAALRRAARAPAGS